MEKRHVVVLLCGLSSFVCYADRVNISVAILHMNLDTDVRGWVLGSFFYGYFTTQVVGGLLSARYGGRHVLNVAVAWWSLFTFLTPWAAHCSVPVLLTCRVGMGVGEGMAFPALYDILSQWVPPSERARSFAVMQLGSMAGTVLALAVCPSIIVRVGWPVVFYGFGTLGFLWNISWMIFTDAVPPVDYHLMTGKADEHRSVPDDNHSADEESVDGSSKRGGSPSKAPAAVKLVGDSGSAVVAADHEELQPAPFAADLSWKLAKQLLSRPAVWALVAAHVAYNWGHYTLLSWLPTYLSEAHGVPPDNLGLSTIPYAAMSVSVASWSALADWWVSRASLTTVRKGMTSIGLGGAAILIVLVAQSGSAATALFFVSLTLGVQSAAASGCLINHVDLTPRHSAVLLSISNTAATLPGMVAVPLASSIMAMPGGQWQHVFLLTSMVYGLGLLIYRRFMSAEALVLDL